MLHMLHVLQGCFINVLYVTVRAQTCYNHTVACYFAIGITLCQAQQVARSPVLIDFRTAKAAVLAIPVGA